MSRPLVLLILDLHPTVSSPCAALQLLGRWNEAACLAAAHLASLFTATEPSVHGVLSEWEPRPDGLELRPAPRQRLMQPPLWERVDGATAVALPWSTGSRCKGHVIGAEFLRARDPGIMPVLPDRVWPPTVWQVAEAARVLPHDLQAGTIASLGYEGASPLALSELRTTLSAHNAATLLMERECPALLMARWQLLQRPPQPAAISRFLQAAVSRYHQLAPDCELRLLIRSPSDGGSLVCSVWSMGPGPALGSSLQFGVSLTEHLGVGLPPARPLDTVHWARLRWRHQRPQQVLPGAAPRVQELDLGLRAAWDALQLPLEDPADLPSR